VIYESAIDLSHYWLPLIGFVIGMLSTMVGGNGAFFFPPILILFFQVSPRVAIATSLAAVIPIGLVGSFEHYRRDNINLPVGILFGSAGLAGAITGAWISSIMETDTLISTFGVYLVALGLLTLYNPKSRLRGRVPPPHSFSDFRRQQVLLMASLGLTAGVVAGLFGTSGTATVLAGLFLLQLPIKLVIGTSVLIVFINALAGFGGHLIVGEIDPGLILKLGSGAAAGAFLGPRLITRIRPERNEGRIRNVFALIVMVLGIILLFR